MFRPAVLSVLLAVSTAIPLGGIASENPFGLNENHPYGRLTSEYVTPHVAWANPYRGGAIRALVLAPAWSQRETVELAQRLSLDYTPWMTASFRKVAVAPSGDQASDFFIWPAELAYDALRQSLGTNYDVIVVGKLDWSMLPAGERADVLKKVSSGTGLVYIDPPAGNEELRPVFDGESLPAGVDFVTAAVPWSSLPAFKALKREELVRSVRFGKGRVVALNYGEDVDSWEKDQYGAAAAPCLTPQWDLSDYLKDIPPLSGLPEMEFVPYEYYLALVAKAMIWAAGKEPAAGIKGVEIPETLDWPAAGRPVGVACAGLPSGALLTGSVRDRRDRGSVYPMGQQKARETTAFTLPGLPAGDYFLDVWLMTPDGGQTIDWASRAFSVRADFEFREKPAGTAGSRGMETAVPAVSRPSGMETAVPAVSGSSGMETAVPAVSRPVSQIRNIVLDRTAYDPGDRVSGRVLLPRALARDERLVVSLWDNFQRQIESRAIRSRGDTARFRFAPLDPLAILHCVKAQLFRGGEEVCRAELEFPVRARLRWDDFNEVVWANAPNQMITHLMLRKLAAVDQADCIDIGWRGATAARNIAAANLSAVPYTARYGVFDAGGPEHSVPVLAGERAAYGTMSSPATRAGVDQWGAEQGKIFGPFGPFAWTHGDESYYSTDPDVCWGPTSLDAFRDYLRSVYPDLAALNREWKSAYRNWEDVMPLSFRDASTTTNYAPWIEHCRSSNLIFAEFYARTRQALAGGDAGARAGFDGGGNMQYPNTGSDWWLLSRHIDILHTYITTTGQMEIQRSFARPGQIAGMWYGTYGLGWQIGPNTVPFCHFFPWYSLFHGLNTSWFWMMGSPGSISGYAPDLGSLPFFQARTAALGEIKSGLGKLLLAGSRSNDGIAIHFSEASRIADSLYNPQGAPFGPGYVEALESFNKVLEDSGLQYQYVSYEEVERGELVKRGFKVFIMPHSRAVSEAEAGEIRRFVSAGGIVVADIMPGVLNGHGSRQATPLLADLFPLDTAGSVTAIGKGKAVLVGNHLLGYGTAHMNYNGWKRWQNMEERRRPFAELLERYAAIVAPVRIDALRQDRMPPTEVAEIRCGEITFVGLLREYYLYDNEPYAAGIRFPRKSHVYDARAGRYLGFTDSVDAEISYEAKVYALAPYKVESVAVSVSPSGKRGVPNHVRMALKAEEGRKPSLHAFRVEVISPRGESLACYARNVLAEKGSARAAIPWALNDVPGTYTVVVRDVMSGAVARQAVLLN